MGLQQYRKKRNFKATPEPRGKNVLLHDRLQFVIQKHAATRLHYDFRLELDGTLKSWAVPKGPSLDPAQKRLAVHVEDHPLEYAQFEGTIPAKQYGGGTVWLWDRGYWEPIGNPGSGYRRGRLKFTLHGEKLHGIWNLVRMGGRQERGKENWLLIKENDEEARRGKPGEVTQTLTESVASGKDLEQIATGSHALGESKPRAVKKSSSLSTGRPVKGAPAPGARKGPLASWIAPQLATLVSSVPEGPDWVHELKYDGYRMLCRVKDRTATLLTRNDHDWTAKLPHIAAAAAGLPVRTAWLDGEVVALLPNGRISFQRLQNAFDAHIDQELIYFVFDLLYLDGYDLRASPLLERKRLLSALLQNRRPSALIRFSDHIAGQGEIAFAEACRSGMEGLIAKRGDASYLAGRNRNWVKVKCGRRQEFVIGGFSDPSGSRTAFGALLLGVYDEQGRLRYAGRTGTGFSDQSLKQLHARLKPIQQTRSPFVNPPGGSQAAGVHWVKPTLVAEIAFAEWTNEDQIRQASFQGIREDKDARSVVAERTSGSVSRKEPVKHTGHPRAIGSKKVTRETVPNKASSAGPTVVGGMTLSHPDRVLFPDPAVTKLELARYYETVSDWILPHVKDRPLTLLRCPEGYQKECFYQKHANDQIPDVIGRVEVPEDHGTACYMAAHTLDALLALVQMGVLEIHTWGATQDKLDRPDRMILDLDPDPSVDWPSVMEAAQLVRALLSELNLRSFVKTTGGKGLHVVLPLQRVHTWDEVKTFSKAVSEHLARMIPDRFVATMSKAKRRGRIYVDYLRNGQGATAVAAYSTRARPGATVSMPITWNELSDRMRSDSFTLLNVEERLRRLTKDPWAEYSSTKQRLSRNMLRSLT